MLLLEGYYKELNLIFVYGEGIILRSLENKEKLYQYVNYILHILLYAKHIVTELVWYSGKHPHSTRQETEIQLLGQLQLFFLFIIK